MSREENQPGDLSARISFGRVMGTGPEAGTIRPTLSITCETSGLNLELTLTPTQLVEMLSGSQAQVLAENVSGFRDIKNWGKYSEHVRRAVPIQTGDYAHEGNPRALPHLAPVIAELQDDGWQVDTPRRDNGGKWIIVGRRYIARTKGE
jgi:hypothetical protein